MTTNEAKQLLEERGYYTECLWATTDVQAQYKCTEKEAQEILSAALNNECITEQIFATIKDLAEEKGFEPNNE